jgi:phosphatidylserine/phosphatidylglycerophosphate/cardiolipin synthase-like enzyme
MWRLILSLVILTANLFETSCARQLSTVFPQNFGPQEGGAKSAEIYYSPASNLERIDTSLIDQARNAIDMAAYSLTDYAIAAALERSAARGVRIRIYLDREQTQQEMERRSNVLDSLARSANIEIRVKDSHVLMHLKSYAVDGKVLRTGSANLSPSGLKQQDNDLIILRSSQDVLRFEQDFEAIWSRSTNNSLHP